MRMIPYLTSLPWSFVKTMNHQNTSPTLVDPTFEFTDATVTPLCLLPADITSLKPFNRVVGLDGAYYRMSYEISMSFGPELEFKLIHEGRLVASVTAKYA